MIARHMFTTDDVIREFAERGIAVTDISDLWRFYAPLSREIVGLLMAMLPDVQEVGTQDMMVRAIGCAADPYDAREVLMEVFAEMPLHAASALGRVGEQRELDFLLSVQDMAENKAQQRFIATAIRRIERRLAKPRKTARARREPRK